MFKIINTIIESLTKLILLFNNKIRYMFSIPKKIIKLKKKYDKNLTILNNCTICFNNKNKCIEKLKKMLKILEDENNKNINDLISGDTNIEWNYSDYIYHFNKSLIDIKNGLKFKTCNKHKKNQDKLKNLSYLILEKEKLINKIDMQKCL